MCEGDEQLMGKTLRKDDERRKATYPRLLGLAESKVRAQAAVDAGIAALEPIGERGGVLRHLAQYIIATGIVNGRDRSASRSVAGGAWLC